MLLLLLSPTASKRYTQGRNPNKQSRMGVRMLEVDEPRLQYVLMSYGSSLAYENQGPVRPFSSLGLDFKSLVPPSLYHALAFTMHPFPPWILSVHAGERESRVETSVSYICKTPTLSSGYCIVSHLSHTD